MYFSEDNNPTGFSELRNIFMLMPIDYFVNLRQIILMRPSLRNKASKLFSFGVITKFVNYMIVTADTLETLSSQISANVHSIMKFLPTEVRNYFAGEEKTMSDKPPIFKSALKNIIFHGSSQA